jgi:hypothetical protein
LVAGDSGHFHVAVGEDPGLGVVVDRAGPVAFVALVGPTIVAEDVLTAIAELAFEKRAVFVDVAAAESLPDDVIGVLAGWQRVTPAAVPLFGIIIGTARRRVATTVRTHPVLRRVPVFQTRADALIAAASRGHR